MVENAKSERLQDFRHYLNLLARSQLGPQHRAKMDASDIVQQTLLDAHKAIDEFRGKGDAELASWLRRILTFNMADAFRKWGRAKRNVDLERSLENSINDSCSRLDLCLQAVQSSPSQIVDKNEQILRLACAIGQLPDSQRDAIELHHLQGFTLAETGEQLGRTLASVAGLLRRGLCQLRELLDESSTK